jgi:hypothetical protein
LESLSKKEIWNTIKELSADKAPGLDDLLARFYQSCWEIIKNDIKKLQESAA